MFKRLVVIKSWLHLQPHPFRLLLYLEWILLGLSTFKIFGFPAWFQPSLWDGKTHSWGRPAFWNGSEHFAQISVKPTDAVTILSLLLAFGLMGFGLPTTKIGKWIYTSVALGILGAIATVQGWGLDSLSPLFLIVLLRSCLMFQKRDRWIMAGLMWCIYPITLFPFLLVWVLLHPAIRSKAEFASSDWLTFLPNGGARLNAEFSPEQMNKFFAFVQDFILFLLADSLLSFGLILVFVLLIVSSVVNERNGRRKLAQAHEQLYQYSIQIEDQATLQERTRIARDIHDSLGHLLTTQNVLLQNASLSLESDPNEAKTFLDQSRQISSDALRELRQSIKLLRSDPMEGRSLSDAIASLAQDFHRATGLRPTVRIDTPITLPTRIQIATYRIIEEALTNIQKYSNATQVTVQLKLESTQKTCHLLLQIEDNGQGFQIEQNATGFGLRGMQERAESLSGTFAIVTSPGAGCKVCASFPLPQVIL
ncbi:integral membrane sensor signal transduction histidine kinase [Leptolyngbya sp. NIES-3755]|nr:integral membrane sensor signal transduction histidine kinase [Leptolyngbya sp. NIES-3755]